MMLCARCCNSDGTTFSPVVPAGLENADEAHDVELVALPSTWRIESPPLLSTRAHLWLDQRGYLTYAITLFAFLTVCLYLAASIFSSLLAPWHG